MKTRTAEIYSILAALLVAATIAGAIGYTLKRRHPTSPSIENLNARIRGWWMMILIGGAALLAGFVPILVLFGFISFLTLREFVTQAPVRRADHSALFVCFFVALPVQYVLIDLEWYGMFAIWIPVYCFVAVAVSAVPLTRTERFLDRVAATQWGLMLCVYCISHVPALTLLKIPGFGERAPLLMVFLVLVAQVSDILQYVWGKLVGRHLLLPSISPSKTVEGLVGGVLSATVCGTLLCWMTPFTSFQAGLLAFLIAILGVCGGLVMSAIKRDFGIKDWSLLIEGHGGMLDRMDSLCFSAPVFFHIVRYFFSSPGAAPLTRF